MTRRFKTAALLMASLLLAGTLSACGDNLATPTIGTLTTVTSPTNFPGSPIFAASTESNTIVIYSSFPLTGSSQHDAETLVNAMKMALDDFTGGTGKIGNFTINYISLDDATALNGQWSAFEETNNANIAVANPDTMIYLGPYNSGAAAVSIPILNKVGMAIISPSTTYPGLTRAVTGVTQASDPQIYYATNPHLRNFFRVVPSDDVQGYAAAAYMASLNIKKVFQIDDSEAYGQGMVNIFTNACQSYGLECNQKASINGKESDFKSLANNIKAKNVGAIFFAGISQNKAGKLISDIRAAGITIPFMGSDGIHDNIFIADAKMQAEGAYTLAQGLDGTQLPQKGQDFLKRYRAKYGQEMAYTIYAYEAMSVALDAIKRAGVKDRARILQAVAATKDFEGAAGKWSFDKNGDTTLTDYSVYQVKDGRWEFVTESRPK
jgi:branched-chain amino acid transport system substrate-binding protein